MSEATEADRAGRKEWLGLAILALPCLLYSMDLTVLNLAIPHLSADLAPSSAQLLWLMDIYGFVLAGALIFIGTLGGAWSVAINLAASLSSSLLSAAKQAYLDGFLVVSLLCALATATAACLTFWSLRQVPGETDEPESVTSSL